MSQEYADLEKALAAGKDDIVLANEPVRPIPVLQYPLRAAEESVCSVQLIKEQLKLLKHVVPKIETLDPEDQQLFAELIVQAKSAPTDGIIKKPLKPKCDSQFVKNLKKEFIHSVKLHINQERGRLAGELDTAGEPGHISKFNALRNKILVFETALRQWHELHHQVKHVRFTGILNDEEPTAQARSKWKRTSTPRAPRSNLTIMPDYLMQMFEAGGPRTRARAKSLKSKIRQASAAQKENDTITSPKGWEVKGPLHDVPNSTGAAPKLPKVKIPLLSEAPSVVVAKSTGAIPKIRKVIKSTDDEMPRMEIKFDDTPKCSMDRIAMEPGIEQMDAMPEASNATDVSHCVEEVHVKTDDLLYATIECSEKSKLWMDDIYVQFDLGGKLSDIKPLKVVKVEVPGEKNDEETVENVPVVVKSAEDTNEDADTESYEYGTFVNVAGYIGEMSSNEFEPADQSENLTETKETAEERYNPFNSPLFSVQGKQPIRWISPTVTANHSPLANKVEHDNGEAAETPTEDAQQSEAANAHSPQKEQLIFRDDSDPEVESLDNFALWSRPQSSVGSFRSSESDSEPIVPSLDISSASSYKTDNSLSSDATEKLNKNPFRSIQVFNTGTKLKKLYGIPNWKAQYCPAPGDTAMLRAHLQKFQQMKYGAKMQTRTTNLNANSNATGQREAKKKQTPLAKGQPYAGLAMAIALNVINMVIRPTITQLLEVCIFSFANISFVLHIMLNFYQSQTTTNRMHSFWHFNEKDSMAEHVLFTPIYFQILLMAQLFNALMSTFFHNAPMLRKAVSLVCCNISFGMMLMNVLNYCHKMYTWHESEFTSCMLTTAVIAVCILEIVIFCKSDKIRRLCRSIWVMLVNN